MTFKPAKCPNCAGDLQVPEDRDTVKCMYCGSDIVVREAIKLAGGVNVENLLTLAKNAELAKNYAEALKYYTVVLEHDTNNMEAWVGKGISNIYLHEKTSADMCFSKALSINNNAKEYITERILKIYMNHYGFADVDSIFLKELFRNHELTFIYSVDPNNGIGLIAEGSANLYKGYTEDLSYLKKAAELFEKAASISNNNPSTIDRIMNLLKRNMSGWNESALERHQILFDLAHKLIPSDRPLEKALVAFSLKATSTMSPAPEAALEVVNNLVKKIKGIDKNYIAPTFNKSTEGKTCFIATAAFGSPIASEVEILREFRDEYLEATKWGKTFMKYYYSIGPHIARLISKSQFLRAFTRQLLMPVISTVKKYYRGNKR